MARLMEWGPERLRPQSRGDEATAPQPRGEAELDADTEWDQDWPSDDDGDWSGCQYDGDDLHDER